MQIKCHLFVFSLKYEMNTFWVEHKWKSCKELATVQWPIQTRAHQLLELLNILNLPYLLNQIGTKALSSANRIFAPNPYLPSTIVDISIWIGEIIFQFGLKEEAQIPYFF